jgi:hypothetical protein
MPRFRAIRLRSRQPGLPLPHANIGNAASSCDDPASILPAVVHALTQIKRPRAARNAAARSAIHQQCRPNTCTRTPASACLSFTRKPVRRRRREAALAQPYAKLVFEYRYAVGAGAQSTLPHVPVSHSPSTSYAFGSFQLDI